MSGNFPMNYMGREGYGVRAGYIYRCFQGHEVIRTTPATESEPTCAVCLAAYQREDEKEKENNPVEVPSVKISRRAGMMVANSAPALARGLSDWLAKHDPTHQCTIEVCQHIHIPNPDLKALVVDAVPEHYLLVVIRGVLSPVQE